MATQATHTVTVKAAGEEITVAELVDFARQVEQYPDAVVKCKYSIGGKLKSMTVEGVTATSH